MGLIFRLSLWLAARLEAQSAFRLAGLLARLLRNSESAATTRINLEVCFPELSQAQREQLVKLSLQHMVMLFFELGQLRYWSRSKLLDGIQVHGREHLQAAVEQGKGVILLVPHLGNWELMCVYLGHYYSVAALYDPPKVGGLEAEIKQARERFDGKMFAIGVGGMRSVLRELKSGGLIAILPDQVPARDGGVYAPFYGKQALTMTLPHQLAQKTGAALLMGSVRRCVDGQAFSGYRLNFTPLSGPIDSEMDMTRAMNATIEAEIAQTPEQYQWEYKRFKRPPEGGQTNIYRRQ